jgi:hypothetical protein
LLAFFSRQYLLIVRSGFWIYDGFIDQKDVGREACYLFFCECEWNGMMSDCGSKLFLRKRSEFLTRITPHLWRNWHSNPDCAEE